MHLAEIHGMPTMEKEADLEVQVLEAMLLQFLLNNQEVLETLEDSLHQKETQVEVEVILITKVQVVVAVLQLQGLQLAVIQEYLEEPELQI
tara:strand:- start:247 stop:519 length:273 start_codon:yes stop_codon:yes gene_type:complete